MKGFKEEGPRIPAWLRKPASDRISRGAARRATRGLNTVCEEARCPNRGDCLGARATATFLILGPGCTRDCRFCAVSGELTPPDATEPRRVAGAALELGLNYVVLTSPTRDDLPYGGARHFAETSEAVRRLLPGAGIEVLVPDFGGGEEAVDTVLAAGVSVFAHNIETVRRLYPKVRAFADYDRSLALLRYAFDNGALCKSALVLGLGETDDEIVSTLNDLAEAGVSIITIGQYMRPTPSQAEVARYLTAEEFARFEAEARRMGFAAVAAGPYVRSSYRAAELLDEASRSVIA
jgi:lipoic acid synthetase